MDEILVGPDDGRRRGFPDPTSGGSVARSEFRSEDLPSDSSDTVEYLCELARRGPAAIVFQEFCPAGSAKTFRFVSLLIQKNQGIQPL